MPPPDPHPDPRTPPGGRPRRLGRGALTAPPGAGVEGPYLASLRVPEGRPDVPPAAGRLRVASYTVHRWAGVRGGGRYAPERTVTVIEELQADVLALQEVLRPTGHIDPLVEVADRLGYHLAFAVTRRHRNGDLGNAILARWPLVGAHVIDLSFGRLEQRAALAATVRTAGGPVTVAATHLALLDATRSRQVRALLDHPGLGTGPIVLLGDMNAWRPDPAARLLGRAFTEHHNHAWPATYPSVAPMLALDRAYVRGAHLASLEAHASQAARRASDHLPLVATLDLVDRAPDGP